MARESDRPRPDHPGSRPDAGQASVPPVPRPRAELGPQAAYRSRADLGPRVSLVPMLLAFILIPRIVLWFAAEPFPWPDSQLYRETARMVRDLDFGEYNGMRTPGYPAFLALLGESDRAVWMVQAIIGMAGAVLVYALVRRLTRRPGWALAAALAHGLALNQIAFEATVLAETVSTTALIGALYLWVRWMEGTWFTGPLPRDAVKREWPPGDARYLLLAGLVLGVAAFCRPILALCALPLAAIPLILDTAAPPAGNDPRAAFDSGSRRTSRSSSLRSRTHRLGRSLLILIPVLAPLLAWSAINQRITGYFGPTNLLGLSLTQHTGPLMEDAPSGFEPLPEVYLKHRAARAAQTGRHTMAIWYAYPEMLERTGLSLGELSRRLTRLSLELIRRHPGEYLRSFGRAWLGFWKTPNYWRPELIGPPGLRAVLLGIWQVERIMLVGIFAAFLVISALVGFRTLRGLPGRGWFSLGGPAGPGQDPAREGGQEERRPTGGVGSSGPGARNRSAVAILFILICAGIVLTVSVVQALLEYGENARYGVPFQPLAVMVTAVFLAALRVSRPASLRPPQ